jgi:hypothetical protein
MKTKQQESLPEFDFKKPQTVVAAIERQSYKKLSFIMFGLSVLFFGAYLGGPVAVDKITSEFTKDSVISTDQEKLLIQQIQAMHEKEFTSMLNYIATNVNMYDAKVNFVQHIIARAEAEKMLTTGTRGARVLSEQLSNYKDKVKKDVVVLNKVRISIANNVAVTSSDIQLFLSYLSIYRAKLALSNADMDNKINSLVFNVPSGNSDYNKENNVYEKLKAFDNEVKDFKFFDSSSVRPIGVPYMEEKK